jgi:hypothetical protein
MPSRDDELRINAIRAKLEALPDGPDKRRCRQLLRQISQLRSASGHWASLATELETLLSLCGPPTHLR